MATQSNLTKKNFIPSDNDIEDLEREAGIETENEEVKEEIKHNAKKTSSKKKSSTPKTTNSSTKETTSEPIAVKKAITDDDILSNLTVDLNNIIINENKPELEKLEAFQFVLNDKSTFQVVLNQSCYIAHMQGLRLAEINMINNSSGGTFETQQRVYQTVHKMINSTSIGKIDYNTFLDVTSYFDLATLYYGIYMQTFPGSTDFTINCGHCKNKMEVKVDNESFISVKDESVYSHMNEVLNSITNPKEALEKSLVNKYERVMLPISKMIIEVQTPSLKDHLNLLASIKDDQADQYKNMLLTLLFTKAIHLPDMKKIKETGKPVYFTINKREQMFTILESLKPADISELGSAIEKYINKYSIEYKIKSFQCRNCGKQTGDIPVDIEQLLFQQILQV